MDEKRYKLYKFLVKNALLKYDERSKNYIQNAFISNTVKIFQRIR